jgi:hypothetical protein
MPSLTLPLSSALGARSIMKTAAKFIVGVGVGVLIVLALKYAQRQYRNYFIEPNWHVEKNAVPTESHPLAGFYKEETCNDPWGWAIGPANEKEYYISFCGPGGCFEAGTYRSNTTVYNDPKYKVINNDKIMFLSKSGWSTHVRCPSRT